MRLSSRLGGLWGSLRRGPLHLLLAARRFEEGLELDADQPRIHPFDYAANPLQQQFLDEYVLVDSGLQLIGRGEEKQIRHADAVYRSYEGHSEAAPDFIDVLQGLHHLNQANHCADDSDGWRVAASNLKNLRVHLSASLRLK